MTDSALLWALTARAAASRRARRRQAVADGRRPRRDVGGGRLNLLLTDGQQIVATAWGDSLCWRGDPDGGVARRLRAVRRRPPTGSTSPTGLLHVTPGPTGAAHHVTVTPI